MSNKQRKTIDYKLIMSFNPCHEWPLKRVKKAVPEEITLIEFLKNEEIPPKDKVWVVVRNEFFSDKELRLLACDIAEKALTQHRVTDTRSWNAIKVSRNFANGKATKEELAAARSAADAAVWSAAVGAHDAAWAAARSARAATCAARAADAAAIEYKWVCEKLINILEKE
jgi:hypothetical protein